MGFQSIRKYNVLTVDMGIGPEDIGIYESGCVAYKRLITAYEYRPEVADLARKAANLNKAFAKLNATLIEPRRQLADMEKRWGNKASDPALEGEEKKLKKLAHASAKADVEWLEAVTGEAQVVFGDVDGKYYRIYLNPPFLNEGWQKTNLHFFLLPEPDRILVGSNPAFGKIVDGVFILFTNDSRQLLAEVGGKRYVVSDEIVEIVPTVEIINLDEKPEPTGRIVATADYKPTEKGDNGNGHKDKIEPLMAGEQTVPLSAEELEGADMDLIPQNILPVAA